MQITPLMRNRQPIGLGITINYGIITKWQEAPNAMANNGNEGSILIKIYLKEITYGK